MDYVNSYAIMALVLLIIIFTFYVYRNWLDLQKNRVFCSLLIVTMFGTEVDLVGRMLIQRVSADSLSLAMTIAVVANAGILVISFLLLTYYLGIAGKISYINTRNFRIIMSFGIIMCVTLLTTPWTHLVFWYNVRGEYHTGMAMIPLLLCAEGYLLAGNFVIYRFRKEIGIRKCWLILAGNGVLSVAVLLQYLLPMKYRMVYYVVSVIFAMYYLILHMVDHYIVYASGCFSKDGFHVVLQEKERCRENFYCLSVNINNMQSVQNVCSEEEVRKFYGLIGGCLYGVGNRHAIYQIHSSEFLLLAKDRETVAEYYQKLKKELPSVVRLNDKNLAIVYGYYMVEFADASYRRQDLYRILAELRRMVKESTGRKEMIRYEGEVKQLLRHELQTVRILNQQISKSDFDVQFIPIFNTIDGSVRELEAIFAITLPDGHRVGSEDLWKLSIENGTIKKLGMSFWQFVIRVAAEEKFFDLGIDKLHINVVPLQISTKAIIESYCNILEAYHIRSEQIVLEVYIDQSVPEEIQKENLQILQDRGFELLLDQFGTNVCNLKNVLNYPFDRAKIHYHMTGSFFAGKEEQMKYLVHMLKEQGWEIGMDGVGFASEFEKLYNLQITTAQGDRIIPFLSLEETGKWLKEKGGGRDGI